MSWSAEELVKQLRYPSGRFDLTTAAWLMRDAADMIERLNVTADATLMQTIVGLRAELAELKSWMDDNDDSFVAELHEARAETGRLRVDHARAYANTVALAGACARLRAELTDLNYRYECAVTDRDVANSELADCQAAWLVEINKVARVRELCGETDGPPTVRKDVVLAAIEGNQP